MANILIIGGLGYIGSALCELYFPRDEHQVWVVDHRFVPERVAGFPAHFRFVHGEMFDLALMARLVRHADVVYLLAARGDAAGSNEHAEAVWRDNFELPKAVIERIPTGTRIVFPSSANVFGGTPEGRKWRYLTEMDEPHPKLPYAETKREMENYLRVSNRNFTVLRFGTNYGYAPGIRFDLVTNIFLKRAIEGEDIPLHGDGSNWRPTTCVTDCARALAFVAGRPDAAGEIYHVVCESQSIRELAEKLLRLTESRSKLRNIDKKVPFKNYGLSSEKIMKLGFAFEWTLERAIPEAQRRLAALTSQRSLSSES